MGGAGGDERQPGDQFVPNAGAHQHRAVAGPDTAAIVAAGRGMVGRGGILPRGGHRVVAQVRGWLAASVLAHPLRPGGARMGSINNQSGKTGTGQEQYKGREAGPKESLHDKNRYVYRFLPVSLTDRAGFEPARGLHPHTLSRRAP